jgi:hypothetical protein
VTAHPFADLYTLPCHACGTGTLAARERRDAIGRVVFACSHCKLRLTEAVIDFNAPRPYPDIEPRPLRSRLPALDRQMHTYDAAGRIARFLPEERPGTHRRRGEAGSSPTHSTQHPGVIRCPN